MPDPGSLSRRAFLARVGVLGAVMGSGGLVVALPVLARTKSGPGPLGGGAALKELVAFLRPVLDALAQSTMSGVAAFAVPGTDRFSAVQGTPRPEPGGVEARGGEFLIHALDHFVPFPDELARPLAAAFSTALADLQVPLPGALGVLPAQLVENLDQALAVLLQNDQTIPLSLAVALMLNLVATQVNPHAITPTPDLGPFVHLSVAEKAQAFELLESADSDLVARLDLHLPQPLHGSVSGLLKFVGGSLLEFAAFGCFNEFGVFDPASRQLTARPVGWELSGFAPEGVGDGWDELKGYYQGRRQVTGA